VASQFAPVADCYIHTPEYADSEYSESESDLSNDEPVLIDEKKVDIEAPPYPAEKSTGDENSPRIPPDPPTLRFPNR